MATSTVLTNKPINPRGDDNRPVDSYNRASLYSGKALDFDGVNDILTMPAALTSSLSTTSVTFVTNVKTDFATWTGTRDDAFSFSERGVILAFNNGSIYYYYRHQSASWRNLQVPNANFKPQEWNQMVTTIDLNADTWKAYINGIEVASSGTYSDTAIAYDANALTIGAQAGNRFFDGQIAGFKIFNTALTAAQVSDLYNNPEKVVPTGVSNTALKLWLPMMEGAGTTAYDGSPSGFVEDIVTGFTNGTTYPLDSFASNDDDITTAIKTSGFGGCVSNGHYYTNGQKVKVKFTYQKNSGDDLRVLFSSLVTGAGTAKSDIQYISASGEFEHTFTMTADGIAYLQLGTGGASDSIDAVITDVYVSPYKSTNHGTISGATYVNGVGAPVAQSAVIDWNKGVNELQYSEQFDESSYWNPLQSTITANDTTAPDGQTTADKILASATTGNHQVDGTFFSIVSGAVTSSIYAKKGNTDFVRLRHNSTTQQIRAWFDLENGVVGSVDAGGSATIEDVGNGWYKCTMTEAGNTKTGLASLQIFINESDGQTTWTADGDEYIYLWGASFEQSATAGPYVRTGATAQTTPVLLPQGLTSGRDITGVNLFENVRKQGALNLDGNSWAEVHDNASLDFGTGSFTLEAWARWRYVNQGSIFNLIISLGGNITSANNAGLMVLNNLSPHLLYSNIGTTGSPQNEGDWIHIIGTYDEANATIYVNGAQADQDERIAVDMTNGFTKFIGRDGTDPNRYYHDQIAQPRIYNRALTASEVLNNYNATKAQYQ